MKMENLVSAIRLVGKYEMMDLEDVVKEFEAYSNQIIPEEVVQEFRFTGLSNVDLITSDFLIQHGLLNIFSLEQK